MHLMCGVSFVGHRARISRSARRGGGLVVPGGGDRPSTCNLDVGGRRRNTVAQRTPLKTFLGHTF